MTRPDYPLTRRVPSPALLENVRSIKEWTRAAIGEGPDTVVSVTEIACPQAGCSPRETVILVLSPGRPGRKASIHKPIVDISAADIIACTNSLSVML